MRKYLQEASELAGVNNTRTLKKTYLPWNANPSEKLYQKEHNFELKEVWQIST